MGRIALLAGVIGGASTGLSTVAIARPPLDTALASVPLASLPVEAQATYQSILAGGPFPYPKDGTVFGNRERLLPREPRGYYHEYTVRTPRSRDRGARRIVCGGVPKSRPAVCYYTGDHYATFQQIAR